MKIVTEPPSDLVQTDLGLEYRESPNGARSNYLYYDWQVAIQRMPATAIDLILDRQNTGKKPMRDAP